MTSKQQVLDGLRSPHGSIRTRTLTEIDLSRVDHDIVKLMMSLAARDEDGTVRLVALRRLEELWPDAAVIRMDRECLLEGNLEIAGPVAAGLGRLGDDQARSLLLEVYLKTAQFDIRWLCFDVLLTHWSYGKIQDVIVGYFLTDADEVIRATTVAHVGKQKDPSMIPELTARLDDASARVRANALEALTDLGRVVKPEILDRLTRDPDHRVRSCAVVARMRSGDFAVEDWMEAVVRSSFDLHRASAGWVLRKVPEMPQRSRYLQVLLSDPSRMVQRQAILAQKMVG